MINQYWFKLVLCLGAGMALTPGVAGAHTEEEDAGFTKQIEYRQAAMNVFGWNLGNMGAMVKGKKPYDKAAFEGYARDLAAAARLNVLTGFPDDSVSDDSDAKDEIWLQWEDFEQKFQAMQAQTAKLAEVASGGELEQIKAQFKETAASCKSCHRKYSH